MKLFIKKSIYVLVLFLSLFYVSNAYASLKTENMYVNYDNKRYLTRKSSNKYQKVFYDYGTIIPTDNARIFGKSYGSKVNKVTIKYANKGSNNFLIKTHQTSGEKEAYANYTSAKDYLTEDSYSKTVGFKNFNLYVIK